MVHALQKGEDCHINLIFSFLIINIIDPLYQSKFCDSHIILVSYGGTLNSLKRLHCVHKEHRVHKCLRKFQNLTYKQFNYSQIKFIH